MTTEIFKLDDATHLVKFAGEKGPRRAPAASPHGRGAPSARTVVEMLLP